MYSRLLEDLSKAVGARLLIRFTYQDKTYVVEPHLLGSNQHNEDCLCAWLDSKHAIGKKAGWHCFLFSNMKDVELLDDRFSRERPGYDPYNSTMNRIYYRL